MTTGDSDTPIQINPAWLKPFASFLVIECTSSTPKEAMAQLQTFIGTAITRKRGEAVVVATGVDAPADVLREDGDGYGFDEIDGALFRAEAPPSWGTVDAPYKESRYGVLLLLRRGRLLAIHGDDGLREAILRWVESDRQPPFRKIAPAIMQGAFLRGKARGLWLRGTHARRSTKADSKTMSGPDLGEALSPFEDSTFALGSARATVVDDGRHVAMTGAVGTTPRKSLVWNRASARFSDFVAVIHEALVDVEETIVQHRGVDSPYPLLAAEIDDLSPVKAAYEVSTVGREDLPPVPDTSDERLEAADLLERALLLVVGEPTTPHFQLNVGVDGVIAGTLGCTVTFARGAVRLRFGVDGTPGDAEVTRRIRDALDLNHDLISIHYESGHTIQAGGIFSARIRDVPFPLWRFEDFNGFLITTEKPATEPTLIHQLVGEPGDTSLFGWVARTCRTGWLTCDDGSEEVADFVHFIPGDKLSLIHVKKAKSDSSQRQVSASAYEVVVGQATKNIRFLQPELLAVRLVEPNAVGRATWLDGRRQPDRHGMAADLAAAGRLDLEIVIVQPHLSEARYRDLHSGVLADAADLLRLHRLETLLNAGRGAVTGIGGELRVVAAR